MSITNYLLQAEEGTYNQLSEEPYCRFCFEPTDDDLENDLFSPCKCSGTQQYVHRECLDQWRATSENKQDFYQCKTCKYRYQLNKDIPKESICRRINRFLAQHILIFLLINLTMVFLGSIILAKLDQQQVIAKYLYDIWDHGDKKMQNPYVYYLSAVAYSYLIIIGTAFSINLYFIRNVKTYLKYIMRNIPLCGAFQILFIILIISYFFLLDSYSIVAGIMVLTVELQIIMTLHYRYLDKYYTANLQQVLPYIDTSSNIISDTEDDTMSDY